MSRAYLLDIGHSRIKSAQLRDGQPGHVKAEAYTSETLMQVLDTLIEHPAQAIYFSCVLNNELANKIEHMLGRKTEQLQRITSESQSDIIKHTYVNPETLGSDRWLAMHAACSKYQTAVCVVSCGTAITIDLVDEQGQHLGGFILPGLMSMREALGQHTTLTIPVTDSFLNEKQGIRPGTSTEECINNGLAGSIVAMIETQFQRLQQHYPNATCLLSGGDAPVISGLLGCKHEAIDNLVLYGLAYFAMKQLDTSATDT